MSDFSLEHKGLAPVWQNEMTPRLKVGGVAFDALQADDEALLLKIQSLPSGLNSRSRVSTDWRYSIHDDVACHEHAAYDADNLARKNADNDMLYQAVTSYLDAAKSYRALELHQQAANMYSLAGQTYMRFSDQYKIGDLFASELAIECFDQAIELHEAQGHEDFCYRDRDHRYNAVAESLLSYYYTSMPLPKHKLKKMGIYRKLDRFAALLNEQASQIAHTSRKIQGNLNAQAFRVEQKEIGFSSDCLMGTDNVSQCVALMVYGRDVVTGESVAALAHIDYQTDPSSIARIFERMPEGTKDVRLLGARFDLDHKSQENLCRVVRELTKYDVNIISSDVHQGNEGPSTVVLNPEDFTISEQVPALYSGVSNACCAHPLLTNSNMYPLHIGFDLREDVWHLPVFLDTEVVRNLHDFYLGRNKIECYQALKSQGFHDLGLSSFFIGEMVTAYSRAYSDIKPYAQARLPEAIVDTLDEMPLYIGKGASVKNYHLIDKAVEIYQGLCCKESYDVKMLEQVTSQSRLAHRHPLRKQHV